jgi:hypothetical protein
MWDYVYLMVHLRSMDTTDMNGLEGYINDCLVENDNSWFPLQRVRSVFSACLAVGPPLAFHCVALFLRRLCVCKGARKMQMIAPLVGSLANNGPAAGNK